MEINGQGTKHDTDKPRLELISSTATVKKAWVYTAGAKKYGVDNWRKGLAWSRVIGACLRHIFAWLGGEDLDTETGLSHLAHAACCLDFLMEYEDTHRAFDDRYKTNKLAECVPGEVRAPRCELCGFIPDSLMHKRGCPTYDKL